MEVDKPETKREEQHSMNNSKTVYVGEEGNGFSFTILSKELKWECSNCTVHVRTYELTAAFSMQLYVAAEVLRSLVAKIYAVESTTLLQPKSLYHHRKTSWFVILYFPILVLVCLARG